MLACAWLFSTQDVMLLFLSRVDTLFEQEFFKDTSQFGDELSEIEQEKCNLNDENESINQNDFSSRLNYLKKLEYNFKSKLNSMHSCLREKSNLTHEVCNYYHYF